MEHLAHIGWNTRAGQNEKTELTVMVSLESYGIPNGGGDLPFVNQSRFVSPEKQAGIKMGQLDILISFPRFRHIQDTLTYLLGRGGLPTPFGILKENSPFPFQLPFEDFVRYAGPIFRYDIHFIGFYGCKVSEKTDNSEDWRCFIPRVGGVLFRGLAMFHVASPPTAFEVEE